MQGAEDEVRAGGAHPLPDLAKVGPALDAAPGQHFPVGTELGADGQHFSARVGDPDVQELRVVGQEAGEGVSRDTPFYGGLELDPSSQALDRRLTLGQIVANRRPHVARDPLLSGVRFGDLGLVGRAGEQDGETQGRDHDHEHDAIEDVLLQAEGHDRVAGGQPPGSAWHSQEGLGDEGVQDAVEDLLDEEQGHVLAAQSEGAAVDEDGEGETAREPVEGLGEDQAPESPVEEACGPGLDQVHEGGQVDGVRGGEKARQGDESGQDSGPRAQGHEADEDDRTPEHELGGLLGEQGNGGPVEPEADEAEESGDQITPRRKRHGWETSRVTEKCPSDRDLRERRPARGSDVD